ncbi:MAG TPA: hypothetical protein GX736_01295 [Mogibacterium sp.]|nr:hypothetical protein [Mogibacterium sp.]
MKNKLANFIAGLVFVDIVYYFHISRTYDITTDDLLISKTLLFVTGLFLMTYFFKLVFSKK